ncbi:MAG: ComF family protein [Patescibacteria group bacterium]
MLIKIIHKLEEYLTWLFPVKCFGCAGPGEYYCQKCLSELSGPFTGRAEFISIIFFASDYADSGLKSAVKALKYRSGWKIAPIFGGFLASNLKSSMGQVLKEKPRVMPVPMAKSRLKERGFNHAELIARVVSAELSLTFDPGILVKLKNTLPQAECADRRERLENIIGSFGLNPGSDVRGKNILLIDDVSTTGATLNEAARVLREAGANKIFAAVVARG